MPHLVVSPPPWIEGDAPVHRLTVEIRVAFRDCDPMGVLWHGNYLGYCEIARDALARSLGFGVARLHELGLYAPVVRSQVVHRSPVRPEDTLTVEVGLWSTRQPRLWHHYGLRVKDRPVAEAETEQVLTDRAFSLLLAQPPELVALFA